MNYAKCRRIIFISMVTSFLLGCDKKEEEARKLGFSGVAEMESIHAQGWHTKYQFDADKVNFAKKEEIEKDRIKDNQARVSGFENYKEMVEIKSKGFNSKNEWIKSEEKRVKLENERLEIERAINEKNQKIIEFARDFPYYAIISCGTHGWENINTVVCFSGRRQVNNLELQNGGDYGLYSPIYFDKIGEYDKRGFVINLRSNFYISMENSSDIILGLRIFDRLSEKLVFQKQVSKYGNISLRNAPE